MIRQYLDALIRSMDEKKEVLEALSKSTEQQKAAMEAETPDWPAFDKMLDEKGELIDKLNKLDDGFNAVFERIKQELLENKEMYISSSYI